MASVRQRRRTSLGAPMLRPNRIRSPRSKSGFLSRDPVFCRRCVQDVGIGIPPQRLSRPRCAAATRPVSRSSPSTRLGEIPRLGEVEVRDALVCAEMMPLGRGVIGFGGRDARPSAPSPGNSYQESAKTPESSAAGARGTGTGTAPTVIFLLPPYRRQRHHTRVPTPRAQKQNPPARKCASSGSIQGSSTRTARRILRQNCSFPAVDTQYPRPLASRASSAGPSRSFFGSIRRAMESPQTRSASDSRSADKQLPRRPPPGDAPTFIKQERIRVFKARQG